MSDPDITPQQRREHADPHEAHHPVPAHVIALVVLMTLVGMFYILSSSVNSPAAWGDDREQGELAGPGSTAAGTASAVDGAALYAARCAACHQADGRGLPGVFPPLAGSEWVKGKDRIAVAIVLQGVTGELKVAGHTFNGAMPGFKAQLDDAQVAAVISHVRARWGNAASPVTRAQVADVRQALGDRSTPFSGQQALESWP